MRIKSVGMACFKAQTRSVEVGPLNLLLGPNECGKTAVLEAIRLAVEGRTSLGGKPDDTIMLCGPTGGLVGLSTDDGFSFIRRFERDPRTGSVKSTIEIEGSKGMGVREADAEIKSHLGCFAPAFNLGAFLGLSPDKRRDFVLDLCSKHGPAGDVDAEEVADMIEVAFLAIDLGAGTVQMAFDNGSTSDALIEKLPSDKAECFKSALAMIQYELTGDTTTAIAAAIDRAKELAKHSKAEKERAQAAAQKLSAERVELTVVSDAVDVLEGVLANQNRDRDILIESIGNAEGCAQSIEAEVRKVADIDTTIEATRAALDEASIPPGESEDLNQLRRDAERLEADNPEPDKLRIEKATASLELARSRVNKLMEEQDALCASLHNTDQERRAFTSLLESLKSDDWRRAKDAYDYLVGRLEPEGHDQIAAWSKLGEIINRNVGKGNIDEIESKLAELSEKVDSLDLEDKKLVASLDDARNEVRVANDEYVFENTDYQARISRFMESLRKACELRLRADEIESRASRLSERIETNKKALETLQADRVAAEKRLTELRSGEKESAESLCELLSEQNDAIAETTNRIKAKRSYQLLEQQFTKCIASAEREQVMHDTAKTLTKAIKDVRETLMADLIRPLVGRLSSFFQVARPNHKVFCDLIDDRGSPAFGLGWVRNGTDRVSLPAMSGGEAAVFCAGLAYALVSMSDAPLKVLMLEASKIDTTNLGSLLNALVSVRGDLSNVFVETCHAKMPESDLWLDIRPGDPEVAEEVVS